MAKVFKINQKICSKNTKCFKIGKKDNKYTPKGEENPPKNMVAISAEYTNKQAYSAKKNNANFIPEYSTLYPLTSSLSASAKSKGVLFSSAMEQIKNTKNPIIDGNIFHSNKLLWLSAILARFIELFKITTAKAEVSKGNS